MEKNLVTIQEAKAVTSSLQVSQTFGKNHQHVIRDVENIKKDVSNFGQMFVESSYLDSYKRKQRMYVINRDGFTLLAMGFTGKKALQFKIDYINAFNRMEEYIKQQSQVPTYPTLSKRKATGKRVETYLPNEDVLRLQIAAYQKGYSSTYNLLQCLVYDFLDDPHGDKETIRELSKAVNMMQNNWREAEKEADYYKERYQDRCDFLEEILPMVQEMNRTIIKLQKVSDEEKRLIRKAKAEMLR